MAHATDPIERFLSRVQPQPDGCWLWIGGRNTHGYGVFYVRYDTWTAHRFSYAHFVGPIPEGLQLDHLCHGPSCPSGRKCLHRRCVNPDHLEPVTSAENTRRGNPNRALTRPLSERGHPVCINGHELTPEVKRRRAEAPHLFDCVLCRRERLRRRRAARRAAL